MLEFTTQEILNGIQKNNSIVVQYIYDKYFHGIKKFIEKFGGSKDDALDVFQDGIVLIYEQLISGEIKQIDSFKGYFFSICKFKWFNTIRNGKVGDYTNVEMEEILPSFEFNQHSESWNDQLEKEKRVKVYFNSFMELESTCQMMIRYVAYGWTIEDIADKMNLSVTYTYRKRKACLNKLIQLVEERLKENKNMS